MAESRDCTKSYRLMGGDVEISIHDADSVIAEPLLDATFAHGKELERTFSIYNPASELSLLNKERKRKISPGLLAVLKEALRFCALSDGAYDISLGKAFLSRKKQENVPLLACSYKDIRITDNEVVLLHPDVLVDLGSIAKGYIAEEMAAFLRVHGVESGHIDARGDVVTFGCNEVIDVQHPRENAVLCSINAADTGIATSGDYRQFSGDFRASHILNAKDIISATVVADDLAIADSCATVAFVLDKSARKAFFAKVPVKAMLIDRTLGREYYNGFEDLLVRGES